MVIYKVTNLLNNKSYVGITTRPIEVRWKEHCSKGNALNKGISKYGRENFKIEQIDTAISEEDMLSKERYWIAKLNTLAPNGYNLTNGGELNKSLSLETRKKMSEAQKGSKNSNFGTHTTAKAIYCITNDKEYISATEAAKKLSLTRSNIVRVMKGERKHTKGYVFRYK